MDLEGLASEGDLNISPERLRFMSTIQHEETNFWLQEDAKYFLHQALSTPCLNVLLNTSPTGFNDLQGNAILDFHGNNVHQVGFGHPKVIAAIKLQMETLSFCTRRYTNQPAIIMAKKLTELTGGQLSKVLLAPSGAVAVSMALKLARVATGRYKTVSFRESFHGATLDTIAVGGEAHFHNQTGPLAPGAIHVPPPDPVNCPWKCGSKCNLQCAEYLGYVLKKEGDIAAVVGETVRSSPIIPPAGYWTMVRNECDKFGTLLILDEIPQCLGRTGKMFAYEHYDILPDILVIGKGLGGGIFPLAAMVCREELQVGNELSLGHFTHEKNPVACAASIAAIDIIENEITLNEINNKSKVWEKLLLELQMEFPLIIEVRCLGLTSGVVIADNFEGHAVPDAAEQIMYKSLQLGLNFKVSMSNILTLTPPLIITEEELNTAYNILQRALRAVQEQIES